MTTKIEFNDLSVDEQRVEAETTTDLALMEHIMWEHSRWTIALAWRGSYEPDVVPFQIRVAIAYRATQLFHQDESVYLDVALEAFERTGQLAVLRAAEVLGQGPALDLDLIIALMEG